jgi:hypothetical protein
MPNDENPFRRLCYTALSMFGTDDIEMDDALWYIKWRNQEIEDARKR